jgi:hypothetical protein
MRLSISLNGSAPITASLAGPGYLSAHLTMADRLRENDHGRTVRAIGIETRETETIYTKWPQLDLQVEDIVEVRILPEGDGDALKERKTSSEAPFNLLSGVELANEVVHAVSEFEKNLMQLLEKAKKTEPAEDYKEFQRACGSVAFELGENLLYPIYRRHKKLIPEDLKGELL